MPSCEVCGGPLPLPSRKRANTICRRCGSTYEFAPVSEEELYQRVVAALQINIKKHSDAMLFSINPFIPIPPANGKIWAIRVQDIARQLWFNWDRPAGWTPGMALVWSPRAPEVTVGIDTLYIAFYAVNEGGGGDLMFQMRADAETIAQKTVYVGAGAGDGVESGTIPMPDRTYEIWIGVAP